MRRRTCNTVEAKTRLSELLDEVEAGGEIVILRRGTAVARLVAPLPGGDDSTAADALVARLGNMKARYQPKTTLRADAVELVRELRDER
jgi:antitoxin (DNA-binding transcriptional repressor) of toxin-antitoxin stability system